MIRSFIKSNYFNSIALFNKLKMEKSKSQNRQCLLHNYKLGRNASEAKRNICQTNGKRSFSTKTACR